MKKGLLVLLVLFVLNIFPTPIEAAYNTKETAQTIQFGTNYKRVISPTTELYGSDHYIKFTAPSDGVIRLMFTEPVDAVSGKPHLLFYHLSNSNGEVLTYGYNNDPKICSNTKNCGIDMGVKKGTYYVNLRLNGVAPGPSYNYTYYVAVTFKTDPYYEREVNNGTDQNYTSFANPITFNQVYKGNTLFNMDFFKLNLLKNRKIQFRILTPSIFKDSRYSHQAMIMSPGEYGFEYVSMYDWTVSKDTKYIYRVKDAKKGENIFYFQNDPYYYHHYQFAVYPHFTDLANESEFFPYITDLAAKYYLDGYPDGRFGVNNQITRAEAATIIVNTLKLSTTTTTTRFKDVPTTYWANRHITAAANAGLLKGYSDGSFKPNAPITRAELATIVSKAYGLTVVSSNIKTFKDIPSNYWALNAINILSSNGIINGFADGTFKPSANATRAQFAKIISISLKK